MSLASKFERSEERRVGKECSSTSATRQFELGNVSCKKPQPLTNNLTANWTTQIRRRGNCLKESVKVSRSYSWNRRSMCIHATASALFRSRKKKSRNSRLPLIENGKLWTKKFSMSSSWSAILSKATHDSNRSLYNFRRTWAGHTVRSVVSHSSLGMLRRLFPRNLLGLTKGLQRQQQQRNVFKN